MKILEGILNLLKKILGIKSPSKGDHILQNKKEDKKMKILEGKEKVYKDWYDKNSDGYSRACKKCSWKDKCEGNKQQCRVDVFIDDFCKKCDFWNTESLICMFGELDCDDPDRRKCREFLGSKG